MKFIASCIQLNSQDDVAANVQIIEKLVREAAAQGASFITLPENAFFMRGEASAKQDQQIGVEVCKGLAKELGVSILIGSVHIPTESGKSYNRSILINNLGEIISQYDKIHLFDVTLKNGEVYKESDRIIAGSEAVIANKIGMTICYDLRFPHLYRSLAQNGAEVFTIPSAFTYLTGKAHWHSLLRARAIENGCFVIAPAQCGYHPNNRRTYGHSMIISPFGEVLKEASENNIEIITTDIDTSLVSDARSQIGSLINEQQFKIKAN